jgi:hypothetical protein
MLFPSHVLRVLAGMGKRLPRDQTGGRGLEGGYYQVAVAKRGGGWWLDVCVYIVCPAR